MSAVEMNSRLLSQHQLSSLTTTNSSFHGKSIPVHIEAPIILMPSSYDLAAKESPQEEGCFNIILICGTILLLGTISAAIALFFGII